MAGRPTGGRCCSLIYPPWLLTQPAIPPPPLQYAAEKYGAAEIVDPRPFLVGSMLWTYKKHLHLGKLIPVGAAVTWNPARALVLCAACACSEASR